MKHFGTLDSEEKDLKKHLIYDEELRNAYVEALKVYKYFSLKGCGLY
jgi:hypothetical protein